MSEPKAKDKFQTIGDYVADSSQTLHFTERALSIGGLEATSRLTLVKPLFLPVFRARVCLESGIQRRYRQPHLRSSCIPSSRSALRIHGETPATIERGARRPENMGFISQDDSLFPLFYFYGGSVSRSIAPTRKQIYRAAVLALRARNVRLRQRLRLLRQAPVIS